MRHEALAGMALACCVGACGSDDVTFGSTSAQGGSSSSQAASTSQGGGTTTSTAGGAAVCGNELVEANEACDGTDLGGRDCTAFGFSKAGGLGCNESCELDAKNCKPTCDGALLEPGETCDGSDLAGADCTMFGYVSPGGLTCEECELDAGGCAPVCGNGTVEPDEDCDDMNTVGGDGCDARCQTENGLSCASPQTVALLPNAPQLLTGNTTGGGSHTSTQCQGTSASPDRVYLVTPAASGFLTVWLDRPSTTYDSVLYALDDCLNASSGIWCADAFDPMSNADFGGEVLSFEVQQNESVYIVVDGWNGSSGAYTIGFDLSEGTCADPVPFPLWAGTPLFALGSTSGKPNNTSTNTCGGSSSGEVIYEVQPQYSGSLEARLPDAQTNFDAVVSARSACAGPEIVCNHNGSGDDIVNFSVADGTSYWVLVDGFTGSQGSYRLRLHPL